MSQAIKWLYDWDQALEQAQKEKKNVYLDFYMDGCIGCEQMSKNSYPLPEVVEFLNSQVVPLKLTPDSEPQASQFFVRWTPALFMLDAKGAPHHKMIGYVPPQELLPHLLFGNGLAFFAHRRFQEAEASLDRLVTQHPKAYATPEGIYYRAICRYRIHQDHHHMQLAHEQLEDEYPGSEWVERTDPYMLLP